jgi:hypothetical protein
MNWTIFDKPAILSQGTAVKALQFFAGLTVYRLFLNTTSFSATVLMISSVVA